MKLSELLNFTVTPEPAPEPTPEPAPEPTPEPTPEPAPEPTPEPAPEPTPEPDYLTRTEFQTILKAELAELVKDMQVSNREKEVANPDETNFNDVLRKHFEE